MVLVVKNLPANAGVPGGTGLVPGLGRSPGGEHGNPLQYCRLENPLGRGAWWATVHGVTKSQTRLKRLGLHMQPSTLGSVCSLFLQAGSWDCASRRSSTAQDGEADVTFTV